MPDTNGKDAPTPPRLQVLIESDGYRQHTRGNCPLDIMEMLLMRALKNIGRDILVAQLAQHQALQDKNAPRIHLPGAPV